MSKRSPEQAGSRRTDGLLTTGDMARYSGNTLRTVRFYEEAGLISPIHRTEGRHRLFAEGQLKRLQLITDLRTAGFSLDEIRDVLESKKRSSSGAEAARELAARLDGQIAVMRNRLVVLERLVRDLEDARELLTRCPHCGRVDYRPERCAQCEHLAARAGKGGVPGTLRVLWDMEK